MAYLFGLLGFANGCRVVPGSSLLRILQGTTCPPKRDQGCPSQTNNPRMPKFLVLEAVFKWQPGKPVACNNGLLSINYGLLYGIVACYFRLLGVPGTL